MKLQNSRSAKTFKTSCVSNGGFFSVDILNISKSTESGHLKTEQNPDLKFIEYSVCLVSCPGSLCWQGIIEELLYFYLFIFFVPAEAL